MYKMKVLKQNTINSFKKYCKNYEFKSRICERLRRCFISFVATTKYKMKRL